MDGWEGAPLLARGGVPLDKLWRPRFKGPKQSHSVPTDLSGGEASSNLRYPQPHGSAPALDRDQTSMQVTMQLQAAN